MRFPIYIYIFTGSKNGCLELVHGMHICRVDFNALRQHKLLGYASYPTCLRMYFTRVCLHVIQFCLHHGVCVVQEAIKTHDNPPSLLLMTALLHCYP